ncbi:MAG: dihydroxy-acid dehydratase, partial [Corallococcus sp.]|nr:dihydroxy-acid dehydratase [Corallococcus sp.]
SGKISHEILEKIEKSTPLVFGNECESYGANSFNCILETLGFAVRGSSTSPAESTEIKYIARETGKNAVYMANTHLSPKRMISQDSLKNAIVLDLACGGSSTSVLNLIAIAKELNFRNINLETIGDLAKTTPVLLDYPRNGSTLMHEFHRAGGVYAVLKSLLDAKLLCGDCTIYNDETIASILENIDFPETKTIRTLETSVSSSAHLRVLFGNIAEEGCICHYHNKGNFVGVAKVYDSEETAVDAVLHREIRPGDVVVVKNEGPHSCPGMREVSMLLALLSGLDLENRVAVITDGRIADFYRGIAVGHITPESDAASTFSALQDGDEIEISTSKGKVSCDIKAKEMQQRIKNLESNSAANYGNYFLKNWARNCTSASEGCVVKATKK